MIRKIHVRDIPRIREMESHHQIGDSWEFGPDYVDGLAFTDSNDKPVVVVAAWHRAEVHLLMDGGWGTPGVRMAALSQIHRAMEQNLKEKGIGQVITWPARSRAFARRLMQLGWVTSGRISWHRRVV